MSSITRPPTTTEMIAMTRDVVDSLRNATIQTCTIAIDLIEADRAEEAAQVLRNVRTRLHGEGPQDGDSIN